MEEVEARARTVGNEHYYAALLQCRGETKTIRIPEVVILVIKILAYLIHYSLSIQCDKYLAYAIRLRNSCITFI